MAELERGTLVYFTPYWMTLSSKFLIDPQHSTAKRQQRTQAFTSQLAHASLERQLASLTTTKNELEKKLREKDSMIDRLEKDRRWLSERETEEREEKERERLEWDEAKVCISCSKVSSFLRRKTQLIPSLPTAEIRTRYTILKSVFNSSPRRARRSPRRAFLPLAHNFPNYRFSEIANRNYDTPNQHSILRAHRTQINSR